MQMKSNGRMKLQRIVHTAAALCELSEEQSLLEY